MRILIVGSGGREHALAWKISQNPQVTKIHIAPGNGGTAEVGQNIALRDDDIPGLMAYIHENEIDFVIPGPELPLVLGLVDACKAEGIACFGPGKYAAQLEGSKAFAKAIMRESGVPTADFDIFTDPAEARDYVLKRGAPIVIKADGLAAGKGVVVAKAVDEALGALDDMMVKKIFGAAGETVIIEDVLQGEEVSFLCLCDGETVVPLPSAQDHKAAFDGDEGPNTGGMGAYSPAPALPEKRYAEMADLAIRPILRTLARRGHPFSGILYAGLMMTAHGPKVLEYNVRFGDPECQPLLMRLQGDLLEAMRACAAGQLHAVDLAYTPKSAICVVVAAKGYPGGYPTGMGITGIDAAEAAAPGSIKVFQAGTRRDGKDVRSSGGRILGVTALGDTLGQARNLAYKAVDAIRMENCHFRTDIGQKALNRK